MGQSNIYIIYILTIYSRGPEKAFIIELIVYWLRYRNVLENSSKM